LITNCPDSVSERVWGMKEPPVLIAPRREKKRKRRRIKEPVFHERTNPTQPVKDWRFPQIFESHG
jgi:hypothetical protein